MSDDFNDYLTIIKAAKALGCTRRTLYRLIDRLGASEIVTPAFGRQLIHKSKLSLLKEAFLPVGSKRRAEAAKVWGSAGGTQKRINREKGTKKS
jgi:excisionase family DNA binding protein